VTDLDDQTTGRGARRRAQTRGRLTEAARGLIASKGVAGLRISEITESADVALGSFYNHFESKDDLVEAIVTESLEALAAAVAEGEPGQDPAELVAAAIRRFVRLAYDDPEFARLLVRLNHADALFAEAVSPYARGALQGALDAGRLRVPDIDVALTFIVSGSMGMLRTIVDGRHGPDADVAFAALVLSALGLSPEEAAAVSAAAAPGDDDVTV
jgi:AcrR family transcriptional regulator